MLLFLRKRGQNQKGGSFCNFCRFYSVYALFELPLLMVLLVAQRGSSTASEMFITAANVLGADDRNVAEKKQDLRDLSYPAPKFFPFHPHRLVMETVPGTCNLFLHRHLCEEWSAGKAFEFDPHNREAMASVLHDCFYRLYESSRAEAEAAGAGGSTVTRSTSLAPTPCRVVDVGSNVGMATGLAASLGAQVLAFEPQSDLTTALEKTVVVNPGWQDRVRVFSGFATFDREKKGVVKKVLKTRHETKATTLRQGNTDPSTASSSRSAGTRSGSKSDPIPQFSTGQQYRLGDGDNFGLFRARAENVTFRVLQEDIPWGFASLSAKHKNKPTFVPNQTSDQAKLSEATPQTVDPQEPPPGRDVEDEVVPKENSTTKKPPVLALDLVKIDTDTVDGELLRGFLAYQKRALWRVKNWLFEGTGVTPEILYDFLQAQDLPKDQPPAATGDHQVHDGQTSTRIGTTAGRSVQPRRAYYTIYRLNMHNGFRFFNASGHDVLSEFRPLPPSSEVDQWGREVFSQRLIKNAIRVKDLAELEASCAEREHGGADQRQQAGTKQNLQDQQQTMGREDEEARSGAAGRTIVKACVLELLAGASWPRRDIAALTHFFVTTEEFEEAPVMRWVHTGPWWPTEEPGSARSRNRYAYPHPKLWEPAAYEKVYKQRKNDPASPEVDFYSHSRPKRDAGFLLGDQLVVATPVRVNGTMREHYRGALRRRTRSAAIHTARKNVHRMH
ncbi:unnamed protein product [Amoebophrya sp. A120]|nr:unnamed protein product [Amoebophrya sp. A120]|eukprot:GSA120T00011790001.1